MNQVFCPIRLVVDQKRKFGGFAEKGTSGKPLFLTRRNKKVAVLIVLGKKQFLEKQILPLYNVGIDPCTLLPSSNKKVWWQCSQGHKWEAVVANRTRLKSGCPFCSGHRAIPGKTDFATVYPELLNEWNYEKNTGINPSEFTAHSGKKVWWRCKRGHEWEAIIDSRTRGTGCPYCVGMKQQQEEKDDANSGG